MRQDFLEGIMPSGWRKVRLKTLASLYAELSAGQLLSSSPLSLAHLLCLYVSCLSLLFCSLAQTGRGYGRKDLEREAKGYSEDLYEKMGDLSYGVKHGMEQAKDVGYGIGSKMRSEQQQRQRLSDSTSEGERECRSKGTQLISSSLLPLSVRSFVCVSSEMAESVKHKLTPGGDRGRMADIDEGEEDGYFAKLKRGVGLGEDHKRRGRGYGGEEEDEMELATKKLRRVVRQADREL